VADNVDLPSVPSNVSPELRILLAAMRRAMFSQQKRLKEVEDENAELRSLSALLKGSAAQTTRASDFVFPSVTNIKQESEKYRVRFTFFQYKAPFTGYVTDVATASPPGKRTELWRGLEDETSLDAQLVNSTPYNSMDDHPPPGVTYRYWLRYASDIDTQVGPFTPADGLLFTAAEIDDPESEFELLNGGVFLETFEHQDVYAFWTEIDPVNHSSVVSYPANGVVGGLVAQFVGDEAWLVSDTLIPYDPSVLYRIRVGVRYTNAPTNPADNRFWCGITGVAADGVTLINAAGANGYDNQHYVASNGSSLTTGGINNWQTFTGYFSAHGTPTSPANQIGAPSPLFPGIKYFRPTLILNYDEGNGTVQVDYVRIEALTPLDIALEGTLTVPSITLPADSGGGVTSYTGATGTMEVRFGGSLLNGSPQVTFSILSNPQALGASISTSGLYAVTSGLDSFESSAQITFRASFHGVNIDRTFSLSKSRDGASTWTPVVDIDSGTATMIVAPTAITKQGGSGAWDSSVYSIEAYPSGAYMSFRPLQTSGNVMAGLNQDPTLDAIYTSLDYAWYCNSGALLEIYESGVGQPFTGSTTYSTADNFGIAYDGETVRYIRNGVTVREVVRLGLSLSFDSSFYTPGAGITDIRFGPQPSTTNLNSFVTRGTALYADATIEKPTGSNAYDSDVYSTDSYNACSLTFQPVTGEVGCGFNADPQVDTNYTSVDFLWIASTGGTQAQIYESGVFVSNHGAWTSNTTLSMTYDGQFVRYYKDNVVVRETLAPGRVFFFDAIMFHVGAKAKNVRFAASGVVGAGSANLIARNSCVVINDTIAKPAGSNAWDSDVYSREGYTEGAFATARPSFTNCNVMFGLNEDPLLDQNFTSLDYAWYFDTAGVLHIYESGSLVMSLGSYTTATIAAVRHVGTMVQYIRDGVVVRSVTRNSNNPLYFDASLYSVGARLEGVRFGPAGRGAEADPNAVYLETFERPWETRFSNIGNSGSLVVTYPNNGEFGGKVIRAQNQLYIEANENIQFDPSFLYRITARIRRTASGSPNEFVYVGVAGVLADGVTMNDETGSTSHSNQHYNCARGFDMSTIAVNTWKDFVGYFKGHSTTNFGIAESAYTPTALRTNTRYFRPQVLLNYSSGAGTMECDYIKVERLINPDDADNTSRQRIVPDAEFSLSTIKGLYWDWDNGSATTITIQPTGGVHGGLLRCVMASGAGSGNYFVLKRYPTLLPAITGQYYKVTIRVRRTTAVSLSTPYVRINVGLVAVAYSQGSLSQTFATTFWQNGLGEMRTTDPSTWTVNEWQEFSETVQLSNHPKSTTQSPYLAAQVVLGQLATDTGTLEVDQFDIVQVDGFPVTTLESAAITTDYFDNDTSTAYTVGIGDNETIRRFTSGSAITITLPNSIPTGWSAGQSMGFTRGGAGSLTFVTSGGSTIRTPGGTAILVTNGKAVATLASSGVWELSGNV
jgi:hypothetical protein